MLRSAIDALNANVAVLDAWGTIIEVNDKWVRFGDARGARSRYVGLNYLHICSDAARNGDPSAARVERALGRLLKGENDKFGLAYHCADRIFRMRARLLANSPGRIIVAHEDVTALLQAKNDAEDVPADLARPAPRPRATHEPRL